MATGEQKCLICGGKTELGCVMDYGYMHTRKPAAWSEGGPDRSFWTLKPERSYVIVSFRCTKCGYLMEFANPREAKA